MTFSRPVMIRTSSGTFLIFTELTMIILMQWSGSPVFATYHKALQAPWQMRSRHFHKDIQ